MVPKRRQDQLVAEIRREMQHWYDAQPPKERAWIGSYCLWWAVYTTYVLRKHGINGQLQAGSAFWRRMRPEQDDGVSPLEFGYLFGEDRTALFRALVDGRLPEMHIWAAVADPGDQQIIDLTTQFWPEQAMRLQGYDWPGDKPPEYFWASPQDWPDGCSYEADKAATGIVYLLLDVMSGGNEGIMVVAL